MFCQIYNKKTLIFIVLFHLYSFFNILFAIEWTQVTQGNKGHTFYVDMQNIKEQGNFIFFWQLINYNYIDEYGDSSAKVYIQASCRQLKIKWLKMYYHKSIMAEDDVPSSNPSDLVAGWQYPESNSASYTVLNYVCKNRGIIL